MYSLPDVTFGKEFQLIRCFQGTSCLLWLVTTTQQAGLQPAVQAYVYSAGKDIHVLVQALMNQDDNMFYKLVSEACGPDHNALRAGFGPRAASWASLAYTFQL